MITLIPFPSVFYARKLNEHLTLQFCPLVSFKSREVTSCHELSMPDSSGCLQMRMLLHPGFHVVDRYFSVYPFTYLVPSYLELCAVPDESLLVRLFFSSGRKKSYKV